MEEFGRLNCEDDRKMGSDTEDNKTSWKIISQFFEDKLHYLSLVIEEKDPRNEVVELNYPPVMYASN